MWTVAVGATAGIAQSTVNEIEALTLAAGEYWGWYIDDDLANLTIQLEFEALDDLTLATGSTVFYFDSSQGGFDVYEATTTRELLTGSDTNGQAADIIITVNSDELNAGNFYYGPVVDGVSAGAPAGLFDLFTILVHEIGHGLGLLTFIDEGGQDRTGFDLSVSQSGGNYSFLGSLSVGIFGGAVPLDSSIAHLGMSVGSILGPSLSAGGRILLTELDVAILGDSGNPLRTPTAGADKLTAYASGSYIDGLGGNDTLNGFFGDDTLIGGAGADLINGGPDGDDSLVGGEGDDTLSGGIGDDTLNGGPGADTFVGGGGNDIVSYAPSGAGVFVRLGTNQALSGHAEGDTFSEILRIAGSSLRDILIGADTGDTLDGNDGDDELWGLGGADLLRGGLGNDISYGAANTDTLFGGAGDDTLSGGTGADSLDGGSGGDWAVYFGAGASVHVRLDTGRGYSGQALDDTLTSIEHVEATDLSDILVGDSSGNSFLAHAGDDTLYGLDGADTLNGAGGNDQIFGQAGNDVLIGGRGDDTISGGGGDDLFVFRSGDGGDTFADFVPGGSVLDAILLAGFGAAFDSFAEVIGAASQNGSDTVIDFGGGDTITLQNVLVGSLTSSDFQFG